MVTVCGIEVVCGSCVGPYELFVVVAGFCSGKKCSGSIMFPMMALGWNCRSICNASTVRALNVLIKVHRPYAIFPSETKTKEDRMERVLKSIGFSQKLAISAKGRSGGICM